MKVFLDANIIVALLTKEASIYKAATRILSASEQRFQFFTSGVCLAISFYFATKKYSRQKARADIELLVQHIGITNFGANEIAKAIANKQITDIEDGIEYYAAIDTDYKCIITKDLNDFHFSEIEVLNCQAFLDKHLFKA